MPILALHGTSTNIASMTTSPDLNSLVDPDEPEPIHYLGRTEVAFHLGLKGLYSLTDATLPPPDAMIGDRKGWLPETIDKWNAARPGRGRWGPRGSGSTNTKAVNQHD